DSDVVQRSIRRLNAGISAAGRGDLLRRRKRDVESGLIRHSDNCCPGVARVKQDVLFIRLRMVAELENGVGLDYSRDHQTSCNESGPKQCCRMRRTLQNSCCIFHFFRLSISSSLGHPLSSREKALCEAPEPRRGSKSRALSAPPARLVERRPPKQN